MPNLLVNRYVSKNSNKVTFPIGLSISKVVELGPLPVRLGIKWTVHAGPSGGIRSEVESAALSYAGDPKLIKGNLFDF